ncbi:MAG: site-specific integrase [Candidatus Limnocylindria bacterium]
MGRRRGSGEGSIYEIKARRLWCAAITVTTSAGRKRKWLYGKTRREVQEKLASATVARQHGTIALERPTLARFVERWLRIERRPSTQEVYAGYCRREIIPALGHLRIDEITVGDVANMLSAMLERGLSPQTVAHVRAVLRSTLAQAMREELVFRNVASIAKPPAAVEPYEGRILTLAEARRFLAAADQDRLAALYYVGLSMGLREGEALALRWQDIDFEARTMHVRHTLQRVRRADRRRQGDGEGLVLLPTKTRRSKQKLPIPEVCLRALRAHRARQLEERLAAGALWRDLDFVFTTPLGRPLHSKNVAVNSFRPVCERAGVPYSTRERQRGPTDDRGLRLYDLRHSCASLLIAAGVPLRVVQDVLRHTNIRTTADRYTHLVPQVVSEAMTAMDRTLMIDDAVLDASGDPAIS